MQWEDAFAAATAFSGAVTASATHEIKNELAVINEQAGLAKELLSLAAMGRQVDPVRLEDLLGRVLARVGRADEIIKRLNKFAHSGDADQSGTDPARSLELVVEFYRRLASMRGVELILEAPVCTEVLPLRPMLWQQALWACLAQCVAAAEKGATVTIAYQGGGVRFSGQWAQTPQPPEPGLLALAGVTASIDGQGLLMEPAA